MTKDLVYMTSVTMEHDHVAWSEKRNNSHKEENSICRCHTHNGLHWLYELAHTGCNEHTGWVWLARYWCHWLYKLARTGCNEHTGYDQGGTDVHVSHSGWNPALWKHWSETEAKRGVGNNSYYHWSVTHWEGGSKGARETHHAK